MNIKLSFTPLSQNALDLLVVVLDPAKTLHVVDDPVINGHLQRAGGGFREKTQKREYFATLPEGSPAKALVAYWSPSLPAWNLWENVKTFTARGLRLSKIYGRAGSITFETNGLWVLSHGARTRLYIPGLRDLAGYRAMWADFVAAWRDDRDAAMTLDHARRDLELVEQAYATAGLPPPP